MLEITPLQPQDRADWLGLWNGYLTFYGSALDQATTDATFDRLTADAELHGAIARDGDGRALGIVHWLTHPATWTTADYCYLEDLFVSPDARGAGAGEALIAHVKEWAERNGSAKVYWLTAESNETARRLYDRVADRSGFIHYQIRMP